MPVPDVLQGHAHTADTFRRRGGALLAYRSDPYEVLFKVADPSEDLVNHYLEVGEHMGDIIYEDNTVQASYRMVAYGDERPFRETVEMLFTGDGIMYSCKFQDAPGTVRTLSVLHLGIQFLNLVKLEQVQDSPCEGIACFPAENGGKLLNL